MSDTKIEWADRVWNPVRGCTKVSDGCKCHYLPSLLQDNLQRMISIRTTRGYVTNCSSAISSGAQEV